MLDNDPEFTALRRYSAELGRDPLMIQGAGGNTSVKHGDEMWIKASGTQLKNAETEDLFVGVDWQGIANAVRSGSEMADQPQTFLTNGTLRPSLETCLHAVLPHKVVIHVHCVDTIALAIRADAADAFAAPFQAFDWAIAPYRKPGANLAKAVLAAEPIVPVYVLANHGLLIGAETVAEARVLMEAITVAIRTHPTPSTRAPASEASIDTDYGPFDPAPLGHPLNDMAYSPGKSAQLAESGLFPDQVLFSGPDVPVFETESVIKDGLREAARRFGKNPVQFLIRNQGAYIRADASETEAAMALCIGDVMQRLPEGAALTYLTTEDCGALLNWDAEAYRHQMNTGG